MAPKFRGGSDDWLDDPSSQSPGRAERKKSKSGASPRAVALPMEQANATVSEVFHKQCQVLFDDGRKARCSYRRAAVLGALGEDVRERSPVAVGDRVLAQVISGEDGIIDGVCARSRRLFRPAPGRDPGNFHVIAANIDTLCIVASARDPEFSEGLVDRFLVAASREGITPVICVNKVDLIDVPQVPWAHYREIGYEVFEVSAKFARGLDPVRARLQAGVIAFCGHSGVGKTSLVSALLEVKVGEVRTVSAFTGKGRHTTTGAILLTGKSAGQARWIDTPGVKEFGLAALAPADLAQHFPELLGLSCTAHDCEHAGTAQLDDCEAPRLARYKSYARIYASLQAGEN